MCLGGVHWYRVTAARRVVYIPSKNYMKEAELVDKLSSTELAVRTFLRYGTSKDDLRDIEIRFYNTISQVVRIIYRQNECFIHSIEQRY